MRVRRLLALAATVAMTAAAGTVLGTTPADAAPAWRLVSRLDAGKSPELATNRSGLMVAAWVSSTRIRASFRAPGGSWQQPVTVASAHAGSTPAIRLGPPTVVLDDAGTATVTWAESESESPETGIFSVSGSMTGWSRPQQRQGPVAGPLENYRDVSGPVTAMGRDGSVYTTWSLQGCARYTPPNPRDYYCLEFVSADYFASRSPSGVWTAPERLDAETGAADIAVGPDDTVVIAGTAQAGAADSNRRSATAVTRSPSGAWSPVKVLDRPGHSMAFGMRVHLAADDTNVTAVFGECDANTRCHVAASRGPAFATTSVISAEVDRPRVNVESDPVRVASSPGGEVVALWNLDIGREERSEGVIRSSRRGTGTGVWEPARTLASGLQYNQTDLAGVAIDDDGTAIAGWNSSTYSRTTGYTETAQVALRSEAGTWTTPQEVRAGYSLGPVSTRAGSGSTVLATNGGQHRLERPHRRHRRAQHPVDRPTLAHHDRRELPGHMDRNRRPVLGRPDDRATACSHLARRLRSVVHLEKPARRAHGHLSGLPRPHVLLQGPQHRRRRQHRGMVGPAVPYDARRRPQPASKRRLEAGDGERHLPRDGDPDHEARPAAEPQRCSRPGVRAGRHHVPDVWLGSGVHRGQGRANGLAALPADHEEAGGAACVVSLSGHAENRSDCAELRQTGARRRDRGHPLGDGLELRGSVFTMRPGTRSRRTSTASRAAVPM